MMGEIKDYVFLSSGILNVMTFLYGLIYLIAKKLHGGNRNAAGYACCQCEEVHDTSTLPKIISKCLINISTGIGLMGTSLYILTTNQLFDAPFVTINEDARLAITLALTLSMFNVVLTLLAGKITAQNFHEVPLYCVKAVLCAFIFRSGENAISGVTLLFMYGSIVADHFVDLYSARNATKNEGRQAIRSQWVYLMQFFMHLVCNFFYPAIVMTTTTWLSRAEVFAMSTSSIVVFFGTLTFFLVCNSWRLLCVWRKMAEDATREQEENTATMGVWCGHNNSASRIVRNGLAPVPHRFGVVNESVDLEDCDVRMDDVPIKDDAVYDMVCFTNINLID